jgi:hypothetical protein
VNTVGSATLRWLDIGLYGLLLLYVLNLLVQTMNFSDARARLFPLFVGIPTALILLALTMRGFAPNVFDRALPTRSVETETEKESDGGKLDWLTIIIFTSFPFIAYLVGFLITVPIYIFLLTSRASDDIQTGLAVTVMVTIGWYLLFVELLGVLFFEGILW